MLISSGFTKLFLIFLFGPSARTGKVLLYHPGLSGLLVHSVNVPPTPSAKQKSKLLTSVHDLTLYSSPYPNKGYHLCAWSVVLSFIFYSLELIFVSFTPAFSSDRSCPTKNHNLTHYSARHNGMCVPSQHSGRVRRGGSQVPAQCGYFMGLLRFCINKFLKGWECRSMQRPWLKTTVSGKWESLVQAHNM